MKLFDVYSLQPIEPVKASGSWLWDKAGNRYLDLYGGHAVISVGHNHPRYVEAISRQLEKISFYSNSVQSSIQEELAEKLGSLSGYPDYSLFLCNSGAEANENALKLASFVTGRNRIIAMQKAFHGRTSGAVAATDNPKIVAPFNAVHQVTFVPMNDADQLKNAMGDDVAAIIIEGIQGVAGIHEPDAAYLQQAASLAATNGSLFILDEVQSGYGRTGKFFAHQYARIKPDLITVAKGMGNGFPIGGVLISPSVKPWAGMLGTTFGGNHLACAAGIAVLDIIRDENLMHHAAELGNWWTEKIKLAGIKSPIRGRGLMIGFDTLSDHPSLRQDLLNHYKIFTGEAKPNVIRLLPALNLKKEDAEILIKALTEALANP
jgi:acetylornithine/N-succinyldiaminopimelate aminotransferase